MHFTGLSPDQEGAGRGNEELLAFPMRVLSPQCTFHRVDRKDPSRLERRRGLRDDNEKSVYVREVWQRDKVHDDAPVPPQTGTQPVTPVLREPIQRPNPVETTGGDPSRGPDRRPAPIGADPKPVSLPWTTIAAPASSSIARVESAPKSTAGPCVMVTGGLGHIGSSLIRHESFAGRGCRLILVDNLSTQRYSSLFGLPASIDYQLLTGDVGQVVTPASLSGVDAVIHLAAITEPSASVRDPEHVFGNNLRITRHVADMCAEMHIPLVFTSTTSVYAGAEPIVDESSPNLDPQSPYALCKLEEEQYILALVSKGLQAAIFRLGTIFGPSPGMRFHTAVNRFCWQTALGEPLHVWSTAMHQRRPYLAVSDAAALLARTVLESVYPGTPVNAVTCNATVKDVLDAITSAGRVFAVADIPSPLMNTSSYDTSTELARSLGFAFRGELATDVAATLELLGFLGPAKVLTT